MGYIHFIREMQSHQGKQKSTLHTQFYYFMTYKETLWSDFSTLERKEKEMQRKLSKTSNVIISSLPLFFSRIHGNFGLN